MIAGADFILSGRPLTLDAKAAALATPEVRGIMANLRDVLADVSPWSAQTTEAAVRSFAERSGQKLGALAQPLRIALTGRTTSPGIFDVLAVHSTEQCLARLADQTAA